MSEDRIQNRKASNVIINRRDLLINIGAAFLAGSLIGGAHDFAQAEDNPVADLIAFSAEYGTAVGLAGSVLSAISSANNQAVLVSKLDQISSQLFEINNKLNYIVKLIESLPGVLKVALEEQRRLELFKSIQSYNDRISQMVKANAFSGRNADREKDILRRQIYEPLLHDIGELRHWGEAGYVGVAYGTSVSALAARWADIDQVDFGVVVSQNYQYLVDCFNKFGNRSTEEFDTLLEKMQICNSHKGYVLLQPEPSELNLYGLIRGDFESGYSKLREDPNGSEVFYDGRKWNFKRTPFLNLNHRGRARLDRLIETLVMEREIGMNADKNSLAFAAHNRGAFYLSEQVRNLGMMRLPPLPD